MKSNIINAENKLYISNFDIGNVEPNSRSPLSYLTASISSCIISHFNEIQFFPFREIEVLYSNNRILITISTVQMDYVLTMVETIQNCFILKLINCDKEICFIVNGQLNTDKFIF